MYGDINNFDELIDPIISFQVGLSIYKNINFKYVTPPPL